MASENVTVTTALMPMLLPSDFGVCDTTVGAVESAVFDPLKDLLTPDEPILLPVMSDTPCTVRPKSKPAIDCSVASVTVLLSPLSVAPAIRRPPPSADPRGATGVG